jgi:hypothetical protein
MTRRGEPYYCKCGHLRSRHGSRECRCKTFRQAYWTQQEIDQIQQRARELSKLFIDVAAG